MTTRNTISILLFIACGSLAAQVPDGAGQYYNDAILFGRTSPMYGSTARLQGVGGTQVSLGGDLSVAGVNPAGLGFFNKSIASFTPNITFHNPTANYLGTNVANFKNNFSFSNLGIGFNNNIGDYSNEKFKGGTFAITMSKINDFNNLVSYEGRNTQSSIIDAFLGSAGTDDPDNLSDVYALAAYETYLINPDYQDNTLIGYYSFVSGNPKQAETIETSGGQYQWNFSWGGNFDDKLYFGAGLGVVSLDYSERRNYTEEQFIDDSNVQDADIQYMKLMDKLSVQGTGVNASLGLIARPFNFITIGAAYNTPTFYNLSEKSKFDLFTRWNNVEVAPDEYINDRTFQSDLFISQYDLRTPGKLSLGATAFLGKIGFVSGDVEFVDYTKSFVKSDDFLTNTDNQSILTDFTSVVNYRLGTELRWKEFRFRGGYSYLPDPNKVNGYDAGLTAVSGGVGYRTRDYYVDLAIVNRMFSRLYSPYTFADNSEPVAEISNESTSFSVTVGFNF